MNPTSQRLLIALGILVGAAMVALQVTTLWTLYEKADRIQGDLYRLIYTLDDQKTALSALREDIQKGPPKRTTTDAIEPVRITLSELSSYIPESCPPGGTYPEVIEEKAYTRIEMGCADSGWWYKANLIRDKNGKDLVAYVLSSRSFIWKTSRSSEHTISVVGDKPWDSFQDFGGDHPITVHDLTLDEKPLGILKTTFTYADGGLGALQDATFESNTDYTGGILTIHGMKFNIDFTKATVTIVE